MSFFIAATLFITAAHAKIWRVNNIAGIVADFTTVQAAHDGAAAGDTIHLEPSNTSYGNLSMTKKLHIVSTGQFVPNNPGFQQDIKMGFVSSVTINNAAANGSILSIRFNNTFSINGAAVANISLLNCASALAEDGCTGHVAERNGVLEIVNADNIIVKGSWFAGIAVSGNAQNILITNNIVGNRIMVQDQSSATISNNVIYAISNGSCSSAGATIVNSQFTNNIFLKGMEGGSNTSGSSFQNNFNANNLLPAGNGNVNNIDMTTVFVNANGGFVDNVYQLKVGSPAIAAGLNGENLGAFGGTNPFRLAVTPAVPSIYKLVVPTTPSGSSMNIIFSTRSNN